MCCKSRRYYIVIHCNTELKSKFCKNNCKIRAYVKIYKIRTYVKKNYKIRAYV